MKVLLDANVVLDVLLLRLPWQAEAEAVFQATRDKRIVAAVTSLTIANVFYVARKKVGSKRARETVRDCLEAFEVLPIDRKILEDANHRIGVDFEDNLQIVSALYGGVEAIVTRDPKGFAASPVTVLTPPQLLAKLAP